MTDTVLGGVRDTASSGSNKTIANEMMPGEQGAQHIGIYTVAWCYRCTARNGESYCRVKLIGPDRVLKGHIWFSRHKETKALQANRIYRLEGRLKYINQEWFLDIHTSSELIKLSAGSTEVVMPVNSQIPQEMVARLQNVVGLVTSKALQRFLATVFSDVDVCTGLCLCPASIDFHHKHSGGLLAHSVECAELVADMLKSNHTIQQLGVVAALLHDLGKVRVFTRYGGFSDASGIVSHTTFGFLLLAPALRQLEGEWENAALSIIHAWEWLHGDQRKPPLVSFAVAVKAADQLSCSMHNEATALKEAHSRKKFVSHAGYRFLKVSNT